MSLINNFAKGNDPVFTDEVTKRKIQRHLSDINDQITEEDIENVKTDVTPNSNNTEAIDGANRLYSEEVKKERRNKSDGNNTNSVQTPWKIIDE